MKSFLVALKAVDKIVPFTNPAQPLCTRWAQNFVHSVYYGEIYFSYLEIVAKGPEAHSWNHEKQKRLRVVQAAGSTLVGTPLKLVTSGSEERFAIEKQDQMLADFLFSRISEKLG